MIGLGDVAAGTRMRVWSAPSLCNCVWFVWRLVAEGPLPVIMLTISYFTLSPSSIRGVILLWIYSLSSCGRHHLQCFMCVSRKWCAIKMFYGVLN